MKVAFVSVSYDFLESVPLPCDRGRVCVQREHVFELCTGCPRPLGHSQHASSNGCVYNSTLPSLCLLTFSLFLFRRPRPKTEGSAVVSRHLRSEPGGGSTAQASRMYVSRTSSSHTELVPEQSQCEASPKWPGLWSGPIINVVSVQIWRIFLETLMPQQTSKQLSD